MGDYLTDRDNVQDKPTIKKKHLIKSQARQVSFY